MTVLNRRRELPNYPASFARYGMLAVCVAVLAACGGGGDDNTGAGAAVGGTTGGVVGSDPAVGGGATGGTTPPVIDGPTTPLRGATTDDPDLVSSMQDLARFSLDAISFDDLVDFFRGFAAAGFRSDASFSCGESGTVVYSATDNDGNGVLSRDDVITIRFDDCQAAAETVKANGAKSAVVVDFSGDPAGAFQALVASSRVGYTAQYGNISLAFGEEPFGARFDVRGVNDYDIQLAWFDPDPLSIVFTTSGSRLDTRFVELAGVASGDGTGQTFTQTISRGWFEIDGSRGTVNGALR